MAPYPAPFGRRYDRPTPQDNQLTREPAIVPRRHTVALAGSMRAIRFQHSWTWALHIDFAKAIVDHTTSEKALLWFCRHGSIRRGDRHVCEVEALDELDERRSFLVEFGLPDPAHTAVVSVDGLRPATKYTCYASWRAGPAPPRAAGS